MSAMNLLKVDNQQQTIKLAGYLSMAWKDDSVVWDPKDFGGITTILLTSADLWLPDLYNTNSVTGKMDQSKGSPHRLQVSNDGTVRWWPVDLFEVSCQLDMKFFPFDVQTCEFEFESWSYSYDQLRFISPSDKVSLLNLKPSGEWRVTGTKAKAAIKYYSASFKWSEMVFTLKIARKSAYYVTNIILPLVAMSFLVLMVFYLPAESGEKISLGITVLLAFSVFQLLMADLMPKTSNVTPILVIYVTLLMAMAIISTIVSVLVLNVHHQHDEGSAVPNWARNIVFRCMAPIVCAKKLVKPFVQGSLHTTRITPQTDILRNNGANNHPNNNKTVNDKTDLKLEDVENLNDMKYDLAMRKLSVFLGDKHGGIRARSELELKAIEWRLMSRIMDRFFMFVYFILNIIIAAGCLTAATSSPQ
ncbi:neuronal acetylcholine receptor subunit alpha-9-like [Tubulanus polymorphus]|uniref:neuronal acetylcholine receptor subunit alpha-9-like n=1 Tax=Tubulanus polymorphus TaxID=672921 RepID=UPI003DA66979